MLYHFNKLRLRSKLGGWAPHQLTPEKNKGRIQACEQLLNISHRTDWLDKLVAGDEKWVLHVNIERRLQWLKPGQKPKLTLKPGLHPRKRMLSVWSTVKGV